MRTVHRIGSAFVAVCACVALALGTRTLDEVERERDEGPGLSAQAADRGPFARQDLDESATARPVEHQRPEPTAVALASIDPRDLDARMADDFQTLEVHVLIDDPARLAELFGVEGGLAAARAIHPWLSVHCDTTLRTGAYVPGFWGDRRRTRGHSENRGGVISADYFSLGTIEVPVEDDIRVGLAFGADVIAWERPAPTDQFVPFRLAAANVSALCGTIDVAFEADASATWPAGIELRIVDVERGESLSKWTVAAPSDRVRTSLIAGTYRLLACTETALFGSAQIMVRSGSTTYVTIPTSAVLVDVHVFDEHGDPLDERSSFLWVRTSPTDEREEPGWVNRIKIGKGGVLTVSIPRDGALLRAFVLGQGASPLRRLDGVEPGDRVDLHVVEYARCSFVLKTATCSPARLVFYDEQGLVESRDGPFFAGDEHQEYLVPGRYRVVALDELGHECSRIEFVARGRDLTFEI